MRHLAALLVAILVVPLSWLLLAFGQNPPGRAFAGAVNVTLLGRTLACLVGAGLLLGLFATLRLSVVGTVVAGAGYLAAQLALLAAPEAVLPVSLLVATIVLGRRRQPAAEQTPEQAPDTSPPRAASRYTGTPRCPHNRRSNSFGPADHNSDRWRQTRQSTWPYG